MIEFLSHDPEYDRILFYRTLDLLHVPQTVQQINIILIIID